jgi:iron complex transport system ATP-binding protein
VAEPGPDGSNAALAFDNVELFERHATLVGPVTWRVEPGQRWVVIGPNGSGKTSLMRLAAATRLPSRGRVEILGDVVGRVPLATLRERIGYTSGELLRRFDQRRTALEVVTTARRAAMRWWHDAYSEDEVEHGRALLGQVGCRDHADRVLGELSDGERQRVLLARALMPDPQLLLLDEPTAGMDLGGRETFTRLLTDLVAARPHVTVVLVTHHVEEVPAGFTHALLLRDGRPVAAGELQRTLTSEQLSRCFALPLTLHETGGRYLVTAPS